MFNAVRESRSAYGRDDITPCYYCGLPATTVDHVIPQSLIKDLAILEDDYVTRQLYDRHRVREVDACRECNSALGAQYFDTLAKRKQWVQAWLRKRYKRVLVTPPWTDSELGQLSRRLQAHVIQSLDEKRVLLRRLGWKGSLNRSQPNGKSWSIIETDDSTSEGEYRWGCRSCRGMVYIERNWCVCMACDWVGSVLDLRRR